MTKNITDMTLGYNKIRYRRIHLSPAPPYGSLESGSTCRSRRQGTFLPYTRHTTAEGSSSFLSR